MIPRFSLLLALGASALVSASPVADQDADDGIVTWLQADAQSLPDRGGLASSSKGFRLEAQATGPPNPLSQSVHGMLLNSYHVGAGLNMAVLHGVDAHDAGSIFYLNHAPGQHASILTDGGTLPYSLHIPPQESQGEKNVMLPVGDVGTPIVLSGSGQASDGISVLNGLGARGTFTACKRIVPYYHNTPLMVLQFSYEAGAAAHDCVPIRLVPKCAQLPAAPPHSPINHAHAQTVPCF